MGLMKIVSAVIFLVAMFLVYNYLVFELVDTFLKMPRLKKVARIPVGIVNTCIAMAFTMLSQSRTFGAYIAVSVILFVEFVVFYRDKRTSCLFCMLACVIHIMSMRAFTVAWFALALHSTVYDVVNTSFLLALSTGVTFMILNFVTMIVIKLVPAKGVRIINQHSEQLWFMIAWLGVFSAYLLINSRIYSIPDDHMHLLINQIIAPIAILTGTYIILCFSMKTGELLGYKEKTEELQHTVEKERRYRTTIDKGVFRVIEVNFNKGEIVSGFEDYEEELGNTIYDYSKMMDIMIRTTVHPEDRKEFVKYVSPLTVVEGFEGGTTEISFDYRRLIPDDSSMSGCMF